MQPLRIFLTFILPLITILGVNAAPPQDTPPPAKLSGQEKYIVPILDALALNGPGAAAQNARIREILSAHLTAHAAWHKTNDAQIKPLWKEFHDTRNKQGQPAADKVMEKIDAIYATFKPRHDAFMTALAAVPLTPAQIETIEDVLTINKVRITYDAYNEIFPGLTPAQQAVILANLKRARSEAIDAGSMPEKSDFFKKYKIKNEAYLETQGRSVKESYRIFGEKQKAQKAAKAAATTSPSTTKSAGAGK